jgi:hypothetical protein
MTSTFPTSQNKETFKNYLRENKNKFSSSIVGARFQDISPMLAGYHNSLTDSTDLDLLLFNYGDTVDISNAAQLIYIPGLANDVINLTNGSTTKAVKVTSNGVEVDSYSYTLGYSFSIGDRVYTLYGVGGVLLNAQSGPTYTATVSSASINEGSSVTVTFVTANTADATFYYTLNGLSGTIEAADFTTVTSGSFTTVNNTASVTLTTSADITTEGVETFEVEIRTDSLTGNIVATTPTITINDTSLTATYAVSPDVTSVNEGDTVTFTVTTANVPDGTTLYYSTTGTVEAADFTGTTLTGSFVINTNTATITKTLENDLTLDATEGEENFALEIRTGSTTGTVQATSSSITIADTSIASYTSTISTTQAAEGTTLTIDVTTVGIPDGYTLYYSTSGAASTTTDINSVSGSFVVNSNAGTFDIDLLQDYIPDDGETFTVNIRTASTSGAIVSTLGPIIVDDTPFTLTTTPSATIIDESTFNTNETLTIAVATANVPDGTTFTAEVRSTGGSVNSGDLSPLTRSLTIANNAASFDIALTRDALTEGLETFVVDIKKGGVTITSTPTIAITDRSYIGSRIDGKTFGPIQVNRDGGVATNISDWYTLCKLDQIPNGSKVAIFIDKSGSMTQSTIQASLDYLTTQLSTRQITFIVVTNSNEDWITPFDIDLN